VEVELASDGRDRPLSKEVQEHADFFSESYAAQEELAGRKKPEKPSGERKWPSWWRNPLFWLALIVLMVWVVFGTNAAQWPWDTSEPAAPTDEPSTTVSTTSPANAGPLSGTWDMYATNSAGHDRQVFTVQFAGTDSGTVDILNDDTEYDTVFRLLDGGKVWFTFTRGFPFKPDNSPAIEWPEISVFEGTFVGPDEISGEWAREDWDCVPDRDPPCQYRPDAVGDPSRLVRQ
jgi:hypothetical protein